ncbi:MAG: nuclear transport factor 2 family protein [Chitinophagaceae bacterium]|nr:nuclear transport factor 2 family protein [Chitinophagaceae bacterium]
MRRGYINTAFTLLFSVFPFFNLLFAQTEQQKLSATILYKDSLFWIGYNNCDMKSFQQFFTTDVEFYHDKGGITIGLEKLAGITQKNLCGTSNFRLRREAVEGSIKVFPLQNSDTIYGAVISGEHLFYVRETGKEERLDGQAKFTHVWLLKDGIWKMARIISYDHGPATLIQEKKNNML